MANITIYLPDSVEKKVRKAAKAHRQPVSRWIAEQLLRSIDNGWSQGFLQAAGSIPDFPDAASLRAGYGPDSPREEL